MTPDMQTYFSRIAGICETLVRHYDTRQEVEKSYADAPAHAV